jgi:hypothetical protein
MEDAIQTDHYVQISGIRRLASQTGEWKGRTLSFCAWPVAQDSDLRELDSGTHAPRITDTRPVWRFPEKEMNKIKV